MNLDAYDFRKPGRLTCDVEQRLAKWLESASTLVATNWKKHLPVSVELSMKGLQVTSFATAVSTLPDATIARIVALGDGGPNSLVVFPRTLVLGVLAAMMGDSLGEFPADRPLTPVEDSLWTLLLQQLLQAVEESWTGTEPLGLQLKDTIAQPKRSRLFADENLVNCSMMLAGPFGRAGWAWLLPQAKLIEKLLYGGQNEANRALLRPVLEALIGEMPVELCVALGATELRVSELTRLRAGDVVIFDQRVSEPLKVCIDGQPKFCGWPGRVGQRRAFQIDSLTEC
jgi:flagellar motor switch protein FliM